MRRGGRRRGNCCGRHRRAADRARTGRWSSMHPGAHRRRRRGHLRRGGGPAGVPRGDVGARRSATRHAGRVRHGRRQQPVHLRPGTALTNASASTSAPYGSPSDSGSTARSTRRCSTRHGGDRRTTCAARRRARRRRARGHGRGGHQPRRREARARDVRPRHRARHGARRAEIDRQIELYRDRDAEHGEPSSACSQRGRR